MARRRGDDGSEELRPSGVRRVRAVDDEKSRFASMVWTVVPFLLIIALYVICYMWGAARNNAAEDIGSWEANPTQESTMPKAGETLSTGEPSEVLPGDGSSSSSTSSTDAATSGSATSGSTSNATSGATSSDGTSGTSSTNGSGREVSTSSSGNESLTSGTSSGSRQTSGGSRSGSTSQDDSSSHVPTQDELLRD